MRLPIALWRRRCAACCSRSRPSPSPRRPTDGASKFVTVRDGKFYCDGKPYYFIGTNYWYGPLLASPGETGDRERLAKELDFLAAHGMRNLRILAGAEGPDDQPTRVTPGLQQSPGQVQPRAARGARLPARRDGQARHEGRAVFEQHLGMVGRLRPVRQLERSRRHPVPARKASWPEFMQYAASSTNAASASRPISTTFASCSAARTRSPASSTSTIRRSCRGRSPTSRGPSRPSTFRRSRSG